MTAEQIIERNSEELGRELNNDEKRRIFQSRCIQYETALEYAIEGLKNIASGKWKEDGCVAIAKETLDQIK